MSMKLTGYRIFVLGAGFSKPAGLPLATELFAEIRNCIEAEHGRDTHFHHDLHKYLKYRKRCDGMALSEESIDLEEFMTFLDFEHYLQLRGSDTWSPEGNESQLMIRRAIGEVIHSKTPLAHALPDVYYQFARRLEPSDTVITLNYDIVLERALDHVGKPYRLFPHRYKSIDRHGGEIDQDIKDITVLKLHGSVDWFDNRHYLELKASMQEAGSKNIRIHGVFDDLKRYGAEPLVQGPRLPDDPLLHIHRIHDADRYYLRDGCTAVPFILSPSHVKFVYAEPLLGFWRGMGQSGAWNLGVCVIGFSLPRHDDYSRIGLYQMIVNYQQSWGDFKDLGVQKDLVRLVDYRCDTAAIDEYKKRYSFVDPAKTDFMFEGFNSDAVEFLFTQRG